MDPDDLYGLPLEQFTARRNQLVRELRREGRRDEAGDVAKLRKPSVAAWAINQIVRTQRRGVEGLFRAGDAAQKAQARVLAGRGNADALRRALDAERRAAAELIEKAGGLLSADGHELTAPRLDQVSETLHAAALDPAARERVKDGCLERELRHIGLGGLAGSPEPSGKARSRKAPAEEAGREHERARQALDRLLGER